MAAPDINCKLFFYKSHLLSLLLFGIMISDLLSAENHFFFLLNTLIFPPTSLEAATPISPTSYTPKEENYDKGG